jgi:hypothetical protein
MQAQVEINAMPYKNSITQVFYGGERREEGKLKSG